MYIIILCNIYSGNKVNIVYVYIHISGRISTSNCLEEDHSKDAIINLLPGTSTDAIVSR